MTRPAPAVAHLPNEGTSAGAARRFVAATLARWGLEELEYTACLLVSELVSNVVLHAETDLDLHVLRAGGGVRVEVHDRNPRLPQRKFYSPTSATGRGMIFVAQLATAWGAEPTPGGKVVWFELDDAPPPPAPIREAELLLEEWEDWDNLTQPVIIDGSRPGKSAPVQGPSSRGAPVLAGCR